MTTNKSHDTVQIDVDLVTRLIANQFPDWKNLPITPVALGGWDNRTFHLGDTMMVRLPSAEHYGAAVEKEQTWLPRIAPYLPLAIPTPLAKGRPGSEYPWHWSVYGWLDGENATIDSIDDLNRFAIALADFLAALQRIDTRGAPRATTRSLRGGSLSIYDAQTREALDRLQGDIDTDAATAIWDEALQAPFSAKRIWYHGDVGAGNLLVEHGELAAVIDFSGLAVGDPACDMAIAWTLLTAISRGAFRSALSVDDAIWARGRGWALWKAMIVLARLTETNAVEAGSAQVAVDELLNDYRNRCPPAKSSVSSRAMGEGGQG